RASGPEVGQLQAGGDELHHGSDGGRADTVARRLRAVDRQRPVHARGWQAVADVDDARNLADTGRDGTRRVIQPFRIGRRQPYLDRLALGRSGIGNAHLHVDARNAGHHAAQVVQDLVRRLALAPVDELVLDDANHVLGDVGAATL